MAKVRMKFSIRHHQGYSPITYKQKTVEMELPKDDHGFILTGALIKLCQEYGEKEILPTEKDEAYSITLTSHEILFRWK